MEQIPLSARKRKLILISSILLVLFVIFLIIRLLIVNLGTLSGEELFTDKAKTDLLERRAFLLKQIDKGDYYPSKMPPVGIPFQQEWSLVATSMTAMTLADLSFRFPETREESVKYLDSLVQLMLSDELRSLGEIMWNNDPLENLDTEPAQAWYMAHAGLTIAAYKYCGGDTTYDSVYTLIHESTIKTIKRSFNPYIETYPSQTYTADNAALYASLSLYDKLMQQDNSSLIKEWITYTQEHLIDTSTGLMKSYVTEDDAPYANSRGSWVGWNSYYLPLIDSAFATDQYEKSKEHLFANLLGFQVLREYPRGVRSSGDIDSGPVIFGASSSGTVFILGGAVREKDTATVERLLKTFEFAGVSLSLGGRKHYISAPLVGDAIALAMMTGTDWDLRYQARVE